ncbi:hypothetical protein [Slackia piriformis]|uniref:hypothetical protein n=1 Tax=Slackia piriformis TaxID=626934 RepID=UPI0039F4DA23
MKFADAYTQIKGGATEADMLNNARNEMAASFIKQLLAAGKDEQAQSVFETTMLTSETVSRFKRQSKSSGNG